MDSSWVIPVALVGFGVVANSAILWRLWKHYHRLTHKVAKKELMEALNQLLKETEENKRDTKKLNERMETHQDWSLSGFRKIGFKRFNPFADTGGNQSFCLTILDARDNGFMISSLHSRENTRLYAKVITKGKVSDQNLSKEEQAVLNEALKQ